MDGNINFRYSPNPQRKLKRFNRLIIDLKNDYLKGVNNYPPTFVESFALMLNYDVKKIITDDYDEDDALELKMAQSEATIIPVANGESHLAITYRKCKNMGHRVNNCPDKQMQLCQLSFPSQSHCYALFNQVSLSHLLKKVINKKIKDLKNLMLIDCASTVCLFTNCKMVQNIRKSQFHMCLGT